MCAQQLHKSALKYPCRKLYSIYPFYKKKLVALLTAKFVTVVDIMRNTFDVPIAEKTPGTCLTNRLEENNQNGPTKPENNAFARFSSHNKT